MNTTKRVSFVPVLVFGGIVLCVWAISVYLFGGMPIKLAEVLGLIAALLIVGTCLRWLWNARAAIRKNVALLLILAGVALLFGCWFMSSMLGVMVGGFLAIIGAVLALRKSA